jgi:hypothetical protein
VPASPARGVACPARELMRQDGRLAGYLLRVRESFEGWNPDLPSGLKFTKGSGEVLGVKGKCTLGTFL